MKNYESLGVLLGIQDPEAKFQKIKQKYKNNPAAQEEAVIQLWYSTHPLASWSLLHQALLMLGYKEAAKTVQDKFLEGGSLFHSLCIVFQTINWFLTMHIWLDHPYVFE